ncbi:MAG: aldehyde dehydrogenase family protein [Alphaproteobacteria bacterium]|nr:aldehyde dehydrogenase family protein [Alphaproteobacteria bacterium]
MDDSRDRLVRKGDYIYGSFVRPESVDGFITGVNPGDRSDNLGRFPFSEASVDDAVDHARLAARIWRRVGLNDRAAVVRRFRQALTKNAERITRLLTRETGKPFWEARQELGETLLAVEHLLDQGVGLLAPRIEEASLARADFVPRGAVAMLCPYNLPLRIAAANTAAAVLSGNTVVFKPSKFTPGMGQMVAEVWDQCKLPRGVINMVQGSGSGVGRRLINHPGIAALVFTGSFESAGEVRRQLFERPELPAFYQTGGKGAAIVLSGCDLDRAVYEVMVGAFMTTGQRHTSTGRVIVDEAIYDNFMDLLVSRASSLRIGYGFDRDVFMGPVISENYRSRFRKYGRALTRAGNAPILEGTSATRTERRGFYVTPAVHEVDWAGGEPCLLDEPLGPTLLVYKVKGVDEAIALHNQFAYRLVCSVYPPADQRALQELVDRLRTGAVLINQPTTTSTLPLPSVGLGRSSNGVAGGVQLVQALTYPRTCQSTDKAFDPLRTLPGTEWAPPTTQALVEFDEDTIIDEDISSMLEPEV